MAMKLEGRVALVTGGASGIGAAAVRLLRERGVRVASFDRERSGAASDLDLVCDVRDPAALDRSIGEVVAKFGGLDLAFVNAGVSGGFNAFLDPSQRIKGVSTGFLKFDEMTGGLHAGDLFILAARPSMGKTALALNIAQHVGTKTDLSVGIFSLEMSKEQLFLRMLTGEARIDAHRLRGGFLGERDWGKLAEAIGRRLGRRGSCRQGDRQHPYAGEGEAHRTRRMLGDPANPSKAPRWPRTPTCSASDFGMGAPRWRLRSARSSSG